MDKYKLSIIIPVYNVEKFLPECIDSILPQSYKDFELILVDDGSKDKSGDICDEYSQKDTRIQVIHQPNSGVSKARNAGLAIAKGEWITFIDSDDWVDSDFLENFRVEDADGCDLICQGLKHINHNTKMETERTVFADQVIIAPDNTQGLKSNDILGFGVTVCKCFRKDIIQINSMSFDEKISFHEDHLFTFDYIYHTSKIVTTSGCGYNYRCGHNPHSLSKKEHTWQSQELASKRMMECLNNICAVYKIDKEYYSKRALYCLMPKINAAASLYNNTSESDSKKAQMLSILSPLNEIVSYYKSEGRYKFIPYLAKDKSGTLLHLYFTLLSKHKR